MVWLVGVYNGLQAQLCCSDMPQPFYLYFQTGVLVNSSWLCSLITMKTFLKREECLFFTSLKNSSPVSEGLEQNSI